MTQSGKKRIGRPPREPGQDYTLRGIPPKTFARFKRRCRRENITMRKILIELINEWIDWP